MVDYIGVAAFADLVTGMSNRAGRQLSDGISTIVSVLAEGFGNDGGPQEYEGDQRDDDDGGEPKKVFDVLEQNLTFGVRMARLKSERCESAMVIRYREFGGATMIEVTRGGDEGHVMVGTNREGKPEREDFSGAG